MRCAYLSLLTVLGLTLVLAGSGCKKTPVETTPIPSAAMGPGGPGPEGAFGDEDTSGMLTEGGGPTAEEMEEGGIGMAEGNASDWQGNLAPNTNVLSGQTVYFDFDRSNVKPSEEGKIEKVATYLENQPMTKLRIEGHCDRRGTEEYNMSLGERRAQSVREFLIELGINPDRIRTVSYGENRPAIPDASTEAEFAQNRRAEFVLLEPPGSGGSEETSSTVGSGAPGAGQTGAQGGGNTLSADG